jgi:uncharacterized hydrophobic protein (TIGR00271 family)
MTDSVSKRSTPRLFDKWVRFVKIISSLRGGTDVQGTIDEITENAAVRGANVWLLVCSSLLASIGLDLNSTAVIIGAMLISPLMSPILGVGLGVAILDRNLLKRSGGNLLLVTVISLVTSTLYFAISPLSQITPELASRTTPTILDVGVAFVGGIAGIVAGSRSKKTSAIPGVAIATALMPPVCTVGFGIAKMDSTIFLGAFYLYFINAFFISLATYLIAVWLRFPKRAKLDGETDTRVKWLITGFAVLVMLPSAFIFYNVITKLRFDRGVKSFVTKEITKDDRQPVSWNVDKTDQSTLKIYTVGTSVSETESLELRAKMTDYGIGSLILKIIPMNVSPDEVKKLSSNIQTTAADNAKFMSTLEAERENDIQALQEQIAQLKEELDPERRFLRSIKIRIPEITAAEWEKPATVKSEPPSNSNASLIDHSLVITFRDGTDEPTKAVIIKRLQAMGKAVWPNDTFEVSRKVSQLPQEENEPQ